MAITANGTTLIFNDNSTQRFGFTGAVAAANITGTITAPQIAPGVIPSGGFTNITAFTSPGPSSWQAPPSTTKAKVTIVGGGGNGGAGGNACIPGGGEPAIPTSWSYPGRGGGGGGGAIKIFSVAAGTTVPLTVGGPGGTSSFGPYAPGSPAPTVTVSATAGATGGNGGAGTNGDLNFTGNQGMAAGGGVYMSDVNPLSGGQTILGSYGQGGAGAPTGGSGSAGTAGAIIVEY